MLLKLIDQSSVYHSGWGAGSGTVDTEVYECPCGESTVTYVKDNVPRFKDRYTSSQCIKCSKKYKFERSVAEPIV